SGIDGLVSTIAGVQRGSGLPTLAILGDLSALYDINGLALLRQVTAPTVVIVVNNNGGQIFSMLPTPPAERERFYLMPQNVDFRHAAALFDLAYACPADWAALSEAVAQGWRHSGTTLIELRVPGTAGAEALQQLLGKVAAL
ncbi:thiamine pyrophosphate-dependent enzyme, partial [Edwardsiella piscicida]